MRTTTTLVGIILIIVGVIALAYQGFTYTTREKVMQIGDMEVSANTEKRVSFPPMLGGLSLVAGIVLVIVGRKNSN